ncbi:hypothetical protein BABINDRAFT_161121 [Babjeviella inositovora NRRL Y-12698]|uniref:TEA domain-containing protein n=1 Tax=Babjeviella inositovora NRRL Y-12698 TaxID=984486 RepID=A0A1E3QQZ7_9ASCO|nr:uncharacterized protein BABINDRAFT_161121 [Babjeviella inositovora NRRL Y-12698]ODQ80136.1 hypothetical protein BABINDRAFT_161121 [Babjeviella inositovora NRRL Y-12698]
MLPPQTPTHKRTLSALGHELLTPFLLSLNTPMHLSPGSLSFSPSRLFGNQSDFQRIGVSNVRSPTQPSPKPKYDADATDDEDERGISKFTPPDSQCRARDLSSMFSELPERAPLADISNQIDDRKRKLLVPETPTAKKLHTRTSWSPAADALLLATMRALLPGAYLSKERKLNLAALADAYSARVLEELEAEPEYRAKGTAEREKARAARCKTPRQVENRLKLMWHGRTSAVTRNEMKRYLVLEEEVPQITVTTPESAYKFPAKESSDDQFVAFLSSSPTFDVSRGDALDQSTPHAVSPTEIDVSQMEIQFTNSLTGQSHIFAQMEPNTLPQPSSLKVRGKAARHLLAETADELPLILIQCNVALPCISAVQSPRARATASINLTDGALDAHVVLRAVRSCPSSMLTWKMATRIYDEHDMLIMNSDEYINAYKNLEVDSDEYLMRIPFMASFWYGYLTFVMNSTASADGLGASPLDGLTVVQVLYEEDIKHAVVVYLFGRGSGAVLVQKMPFGKWRMLAKEIVHHSSDTEVVVTSPLPDTSLVETKPVPQAPGYQQLMVQQQFLQQQQFLEIQRQQMMMQMQMQMMPADMYYPQFQQPVPNFVHAEPQPPMLMRTESQPPMSMLVHVESESQMSHPHGIFPRQAGNSFGSPFVSPQVARRISSASNSTANTSMSQVTPPAKYHGMSRFQNHEFRPHPSTIEEAKEFRSVVPRRLSCAGDSNLKFEFYQPPGSKN